MIHEWDGKSPFEAARMIIEDCRKGNGTLDVQSLRRAISEVVLAMYEAQGRTVKFKDIGQNDD